MTRSNTLLQTLETNPRYTVRIIVLSLSLNFDRRRRNLNIIIHCPILNLHSPLEIFRLDFKARLLLHLSNCTLMTFFPNVNLQSPLRRPPQLSTRLNQQNPLFVRIIYKHSSFSTLAPSKALVKIFWGLNHLNITTPPFTFIRMGHLLEKQNNL